MRENTFFGQNRNTNRLTSAARLPLFADGKIISARLLVGCQSRRVASSSISPSRNSLLVSHANKFSLKNQLTSSGFLCVSCSWPNKRYAMATTKRCAHPRLVNFGCSVEQKSASLLSSSAFFSLLCEAATNGRRRVSSFMAVFFYIPPARSSRVLASSPRAV